MQTVLAFLVLLAVVQTSFAQNTPPGTHVRPGVVDEVAALEPGKLVTLKLVSGKKVQGSVLAHTGNAVQLRVSRGFFRYRAEEYPLQDIVSFKKHMPAWVGPVVVLSATAGVVIGVAACFSNGACWN